MKEYHLTLQEVGVSTKDLCISINKEAQHHNKIICMHHDGSNLYVKSNSEPKSIKEKLEKYHSVELSWPKKV